MPLSRLLLVTALVGAAGGWALVERPWCGHPAPGIVAPEDPQQTVLNDPLEQWTLPGGYRVTALAGYRTHARVLSSAHYHFDAGAAVAPVDLALGWGALSDWGVYSRLNIAQRGRYYLYEWGKEGPPVPAGDIITHSANTHVIPADAEIAHALGALKADDVVWLEGELVEVRGPDGFTWRSSLTRTDTGSGACELMWVRRVAVEPQRAER